MDKSRAVVPEKLRTNYSDWHFSPGHWAGNVLFLSGCTGSTEHGGISTDFSEQCRVAFKKIEWSLTEANLVFGDIVELTSYHVGLQANLDAFKSVKDEFIVEPYPAWTAIGVSELAVPGAVIEIRAIAVDHSRET